MRLLLTRIHCQYPVSTAPSEQLHLGGRERSRPVRPHVPGGDESVPLAPDPDKYDSPGARRRTGHPTDVSQSGQLRHQPEKWTNKNLLRYLIAEGLTSTQ